MLIAIEQLEEWAADPYMRKWFVKRFPSGSAEYQAVLDALSEEDEVWWANYLMDSAGSDESAIRYFDTPYYGKNLFCAGRIVSHTEIHVTGSLRGGTSIVAKGKIIARVSIRAGTEITSRCSIYGGRYIDAGESVIAAWNIEADRIHAGANIVSKEAIKTEYDIEAGGNIKAGWNIAAGRTIEAKGSVTASRSIIAGAGIHAGGYIRAGKEFCVFAGTNVCIDNWSTDALVTAKRKPSNLVSGQWYPKEK